MWKPSSPVRPRSATDHNKALWERACSRLRSNIQHQCCLTHRNRGQARSHRISSVPELKRNQHATVPVKQRCRQDEGLQARTQEADRDRSLYCRSNR
ncbi:hypothetical protein PspS04_24565 [Pseudomonas sp. S04]|nr:hypothetical protein PspS04_24565 [Pseudomonas sp. S04]QHF35824.1 hypothetical protein PspS19_24575 [Pseudomonas sp. S19]